MTTSFSLLPVEIQHQCVNYLDTASLKLIRLVSRALRDIAAEALFGVATLQAIEQSADRFRSLLKHDVFRQYIRQVSTLACCLKKAFCTDAVVSAIDNKHR